MPREPQPNEPFEEPPFEQISGISRMHVQAMETMDADMVWVGAGMHQVIIYTIGRKSGNEHKVAVPVWYDDDGHRVVVDLHERRVQLCYQALRKTIAAFGPIEREHGDTAERLAQEYRRWRNSGACGLARHRNILGQAHHPI
jgi:hypothetical protein